MAPPSRSTAESNQLLCVRLGDQEFARSIRSIREFRGWISSTPVPHDVCGRRH
jgi:chemotaxis signal transduction protein